MLYLHRERSRIIASRLIIMRRKSIQLDLASIGKLATEGCCAVMGGIGIGLTAGTTYEVKGIKDCFVKVTRVTDDVVLLELVDSVVVERKGGLRQVALVQFKPEGAFVGKREKYAMGEVLAVAEPYCAIWERLMRDGKEEDAAEFLYKVADKHGVDRSRARSVAGWYNEDKVLPELMPRRLVVTEVATVRARSISDGDWDAIGVKWFSEHYKEMKRRAYIGRAKWDSDKEVILYRYKEYEG